ncbi:MAG: hypothetical protein ACXQTS_00840 [Candidatus Methanospirareceae archaeon]
MIETVFDPFSGLGTTMFTSMLSGIPSIGIDKLPVAYFISKTLPLFLFLKENEIKEMWKSIKPRIEKSEPADVAMEVSFCSSFQFLKNAALLPRMDSS